MVFWINSSSVSSGQVGAVGGMLCAVGAWRTGVSTMFPGAGSTASLADWYLLSMVSGRICGVIIVGYDGDRYNW